MRWYTRCAVAAVMLCAAPAGAQTAESPEAATARYFDAIRGDPVRTLMFVRQLPKGGDLHSHLSGAVYAETYVEWAAELGLCVDGSTGGIVRPPCEGPERYPAAQALRDSRLYDRMIDAMSVRNWHPSQRSGHAQFFGSFDLFRLVSTRTGDMVAEVAARAALGHVSYLELMATVGGAGPGNLGAAVPWDDDLDAVRSRLLQAGMRDSVAAAVRILDATETRLREVLRCGTAQADAGCDVVVRYQYQVTRARSPELVFAQLLTGFELAHVDPRVVGVNLVQPEDHLVAMRDFDLHMRMIDALRRHYPAVRLTLHAGELRSGLVPPEGLRHHIRASLEDGHASRIGHGTSIAHERDAEALLRHMAERGILVEVALSSNDVILGIRGSEHPLRTYMAFGVPVALVTDDEGVLRTEMTMEYLKAVREHDLGYIALKQIARNSLEYAFVEGASLWSDFGAAQRVPQCAGDAGAAPAWQQAPTCRAFLETSARARLQARLEHDFDALERRYATESAWTAR